MRLTRVCRENLGTQENLVPSPPLRPGSRQSEPGLRRARVLEFSTVRDFLVADVTKYRIFSGHTALS
uniref:Uncharacterized protein n=1 Tax=Rangifer tarandus platyrhynchus TaxID=3082113 RepID=A0ACB0DRH7_RANTA|nr:unnamed protein product [Rangifer tarandus platyrhynchus]